MSKCTDEAASRFCIASRALLNLAVGPQESVYGCQRISTCLLICTCLPNAQRLAILQVNAAVGCLARMPLPHSAFRPLESRSDDTQAQGPLDGPPGRFSADLWQPYLRDTALRIFGSVGLTGQLGRFTRPVLDFTAGEVHLTLCFAASNCRDSLQVTQSVFCFLCKHILQLLCG